MCVCFAALEEGNVCSAKNPGNACQNRQKTELSKDEVYEIGLNKCYKLDSSEDKK